MNGSEVIQIFLASTVIAALISAAISYMATWKTHNLQYITQERKEWRKEIRGVIDELEKCDKDKVDDILVKLKTRINAYGIIDNEDILKKWKEVCEKKEKSASLKKFFRESSIICYQKKLLKCTSRTGISG